MHDRKVVSLLALLLLFAASAGAATGVVRLAGSSVHPTGDLVTTDRESISLGDGTTLSVVDRTDVSADSAFGFCLDLEARFNDRFGLGFTVMRTDHDLDATGDVTTRITDDATNVVLLETTERFAASAGVEMTPLLLGANFHFGPSEKVDLYAGPFLGYVAFGDVSFGGARVPLKDDFAYGGTLGVDVPVGGGNMAFSAALRYMIATAEPDEPDADSLEVDPLVFTFGVGYKF